MNWSAAAKWAIPLAAVGGGAWLMLRNTDRPDVLQALVGCYEGGDATTPIMLQVESGWLIARNDRTRVSGYSSKAGDALLPEKKLVFDRYDRSRVEFDTRSPLLIHASTDHQLLTAIDDVSDRDVVIRRVPCGPK